MCTRINPNFTYTSDFMLCCIASSRVQGSIVLHFVLSVIISLDNCVVLQSVCSRHTDRGQQVVAVVIVCVYTVDGAAVAADANSTIFGWRTLHCYGQQILCPCCTGFNPQVFTVTLKLIRRMSSVSEQWLHPGARSDAS